MRLGCGGGGRSHPGRGVGTLAGIPARAEQFMAAGRGENWEISGQLLREELSSCTPNKIRHPGQQLL